MSNATRNTNINDDTLIEVINDYTSSVGYKIDRLSRSWPIGTVKKIKMSELYEVANTVGGKRILETNKLLIKDPHARDLLALPQLDEFNLDLKGIEKELLDGDIQTLENLLQFCGDVTLEKIVQKAIDMPIQNMAKATLIHQYSGIDVIGIIKDRQEDREASEQATNSIKDSETGQKKRRKVVKE